MATTPDAEAMILTGPGELETCFSHTECLEDAIPPVAFSSAQLVARFEEYCVVKKGLQIAKKNEV